MAGPIPRAGCLGAAGRAVGARSLAWALDLPAVGVHHWVQPLAPYGTTRLRHVRGLLGRGYPTGGGGLHCRTGWRAKPWMSRPGSGSKDLKFMAVPGGPHLATLRKVARRAYSVFRPMTDRPSWISVQLPETQVLLRARVRPSDATARISPRFEDSVVDTLAIKCVRARTLRRRHPGCAVAWCQSACVRSCAMCEQRVAAPVPAAGAVHR